LEHFLGGKERTRIIVVLACVLGLASADTATVGASAAQLISQLHITNTDIGLLVTVPSLLAAVGSLPFGVAADRLRRTRILGLAVLLWGIVMVWSATVNTFGGLLITRVFLGFITAAAGPITASLVGDYFPGTERGRIYGYILTGELLGAGLGFEVTGDISVISWRAAFFILAIPGFILARFLFKLPEPKRGRRIRIQKNPVQPENLPFDYAEYTDEASAGMQGKAYVHSNVDQHIDQNDTNTDAQRLAHELGIEPEARRILRRDPRRLKIVSATKYVMSIPTNLILIAAGASGYFFLAGVATFGMEFVTKWYKINQFFAGLLMLVVGAGAVAGVLLAGRISDTLIKHGVLRGRIYIAIGAAALTTICFIPALITNSPLAALPYLTVAAFGLSAQNPPIDAARLDIVPPLLWGRAEGARTFVRTAAQAVAPTLFGFVSEYIFSGGSSHTADSLRWTFLIMLIPLAANALIMVKAIKSYPVDVATAAASSGTIQNKNTN
jgi:MFS family permease